MVITIKNEILTARINTRGAELVGLQKNGAEYIWEADPKYWDGCAPVLFPMASFVQDGIYTHNGKTYPLPLHGFARDCVYDVVEQSESKVVLRLVQNNLTRLVYPFKFDFCASFELKGDKLDMNFIVKNLSETEDMYFNTGAHEGFKLLDGTDIADHYIEFEKKEHLKQQVVDGPISADNVIDYGETDIFELNDEIFAVDGAFFLNIESDYVTLKSKTSDKAVRVYFDCSTLGFWKVVGAGYLCIEPWDGFCPFAGDGHELKEKRFIKTLKPNSEYTFYHGVQII